MSTFLRAGDTISGQEGRATANINGRILDMFMAKKVEATIEKIKSEVKTLGRRGTQSKAAGWSGTGSFTLYYITSEFRKQMIEYAKNGRDTYFDLTVTNEDPTSTVGKQTTVLYNVNLDSAIVALLDVDQDVLEEEISFTFDGIDILDEFGQPIA